MLTWLWRTREDVRLIGAKFVEDLLIWVDAAFSVHNDVRSQMGVVMSFEHGMVHCRSNKQKLKAKSSAKP